MVIDLHHRCRTCMLPPRDGFYDVAKIINRDHGGTKTNDENCSRWLSVQQASSQYDLIMVLAGDPLHQ